MARWTQVRRLLATPLICGVAAYTVAYFYFEWGNTGSLDLSFLVFVVAVATFVVAAIVQTIVRWLAKPTSR